MSNQQTVKRSIQVAVLDRHARLANGLDVQPPDEFAERMLHLEAALKASPKATVRADEAFLDSFMDRTRSLRSIYGGVQ